MRTEPDLETPALIRLLGERYGLDIAELTFVPFGTDSWSYVATARDGGRWFVKLGQPATMDFGAAPELPLMAALAARLVPVPRPVLDRSGGYGNVVSGFEVQVLEYLDGANLEDETAWPDDLYGRVADTLAAVHASTGVVAHLVKRRERFALPFLPDLGARLASLAEAGSPDDADASAALRAAVRPRIADIRTAMARLQTLRDAARARPPVEVLCHTDIWGSNLLRSSDGSLHLLDWNGALLGPPEHDLFMFAGTSFFPAERFGWFLDRYEAALRTLQGRPTVRPDSAILGFYLYRRNLEDLAAWTGSVIDDQMEALGPETTLRVIDGLLAGAPEIEGRIEQIHALLAGRSGTEPAA